MSINVEIGLSRRSERIEDRLSPVYSSPGLLLKFRDSKISIHNSSPSIEHRKSANEMSCLLSQQISHAALRKLKLAHFQLRIHLRLLHSLCCAAWFPSSPLFIGRSGSVGHIFFQDFTIVEEGT